jgi:hypothetical protein
MGRFRGVWPVSISAVLVVELLRNPCGYAQEPPPAEPQVQTQDNNVVPPPNPAPPGYAAAPGPVVTLRADNPKARLQILGQQLRWTDVCTTPCNVPVSPAGSYRVGGGTIRPSDTFSMPRPAGSVLVQAQVGSTVKHWVGIGLIAAGLANVAFGAYYYSSADSLANSNSNTSGQTKSFFQDVGIVTIVIGALIAAIGLPFALSSTSVEVR